MITKLIDITNTLILFLGLVIVGILGFMLVTIYMVVIFVIGVVFSLIDLIKEIKLNLFNFKIVYICDWGIYNTRYDTVDYQMSRPIHKNMGTAPPWAKLKIIRNK